MRRRSLAAVVASVVMLSGCGGSTDEPEPAETAAAEESPSESDAGEGSGEGSDEGSGASGGTVLIGTVGTEDDPEAFEIALTTEDGEPVSSLPAGDYTIEVDDPSTMHNFHLVGGSVDETTSVPDKEQTTFEVTLEAGEYTYKCDPHPPMTGTFTVT